MKRIIIALIATVMVVLTGQTAFGGTYKTTCGYNGCRATRTSGSVYCAKHAREKIKKTKSMCSKADCYRSKEFAVNEVTDPKRTVTSTCKTSFKDIPVVAVKTSGEIRKEDINKVIEEINKVTINKRMKIGDVVIENVLNSGVNIVISSNILMEERN